jgi:hypothetical protein
LGEGAKGRGERRQATGDRPHPAHGKHRIRAGSGGQGSIARGRAYGADTWAFWGQLAAGLVLGPGVPGGWLFRVGPGAPGAPR